MGFGKCRGHIHRAVGTANSHDRVMVAVRPETLQSIVELDLAAIVAPEMKCRVKSPRHGYEITSYFTFSDNPSLTPAIGCNFDSRNAQCAFNGRDDRTHGYFDASGFCLLNQMTLSAGAGIHHTHVDARLFQINGSQIGIVVIGEHNAIHAGGNAVTLDHGTGSCCQHDARAVVVGKCNRAFNGTRGQNDLLCPHLPQPVAWASGSEECGVVVANPLKNHEIVVMPVTNDSRTRHDMYVFGTQHLVGNGLRVVDEACTINQARGEIGNAPQCWVFIGENDPGT